MRAGARGRVSLSVAALVVLAVMLVLPSLLGPVPLNDSHGLNLVWAGQFTDAMRAGDPWPRWLPLSHDGLGAPVFYFYGPVAFWLIGLLGLAGLATWPAIASAGLIALAVSGLAVFALLRTERSPRALAGAACFMAAPYHLIDLLRRGALAEFVAIALLPLLALALRGAVAGRILPLVIAYAALIATHLPMALLASVFLLPMLVLDTGSRRRDILRRIATGLALGVGLSAAYWLPALLLQPSANMAAMRDFSMQPAHWRPAWYWRDGNPALLMLLATIAALAIPTIFLRGGWRGFGLAMLALAIGLAWPAWLLPPLDRVQFPWRILALAEFGLAIAIGRSRIDGARLMLMLAPAAIVSAAILAPSILAIGDPQPTAALAAITRHHPDAAEYRPRGVIALPPPAARIEQTMAGVTTVPRFAFPGWIARCADGDVPTAASPQGLVRYRGQGCAIVRVTTLPERIGTMFSFASLAGLLLLARRPQRHPAPRPAGLRVA